LDISCPEGQKGIGEIYPGSNGCSGNGIPKIEEGQCLPGPDGQYFKISCNPCSPIPEDSTIPCLSRGNSNVPSMIMVLLFVCITQSFI
jgi:hypothetical protein